MQLCSSLRQSQLNEGPLQKNLWTVSPFIVLERPACIYIPFTRKPKYEARKVICMSAFCWFVSGAFKHYCFSASCHFPVVALLTSELGGKKWISLSFAISVVWLVCGSLFKGIFYEQGNMSGFSWLLACFKYPKIKPTFLQIYHPLHKNVLLLYRFVMCCGFQL